MFWDLQVIIILAPLLPKKWIKDLVVMGADSLYCQILDQCLIQDLDVELLFRAPAHTSSVWDDYIRSISLLWHHRDLGEEKTEINCHTLSSVLETLAVFNRRRGCDKNEETAAVWTLIPLPCLITLNTADSVWSAPQLSVYLVFTVWIRADGGDDGEKRADGLEEEGLIHSLFSLIKASDNWRQSEELKASGSPPDEKVSDPVSTREAF